MILCSVGEVIIFEHWCYISPLEHLLGEGPGCTCRSHADTHEDADKDKLNKLDRLEVDKSEDSL